MQLAFTTVDELFALLEQAGEALDYREVWPHLFPVSHCPPELVHRLVDDIVRQDERFVWESDVRVGLAAWRATHSDLADVVFTVVDLETTGATPGFCKITEIGAVRVEGGAQTATFASLVNPGVPIPAFITGITGIDDATVADAPPIAEVLPRFVAFSAGTTLVAHNARFDLSFLDYELTLLERRTFQRPALDTLRLARKLCPQQRCSLTALAERFDTRVRPGHRALRDAQATAELLVLFLSRLEEQGLCTLEEVTRFCAPGARRNYHKIALTEGLPTSTGVYLMRDGKGAPLYIGKAENLRRRTRDHFLQRQAYRARQALELLERIDVIETGSEFAALLLEQRLIARHRPPCNAHGTRVPGYQYVKLSDEPYPRLYVTPNLRDDGGTYAGPFRKASVARRFIEALTGVFPLRTCTRLRVANDDDATTHGGRERDRRRAHPCPRAGTGACLAPCRRPAADEYARVVAAIRRILAGDGGDLDDLLIARRQAMADALAFEQAARIENQREAVHRVLRSVRRLQAAAGEHAILAYPGRRKGRVALWGVHGGAVVVERELRANAVDETVALELVRETLAAPAPAQPLPAPLVDQALLLHGWLQRHRASPSVLGLPAAAGPSELPALAAELVARVRLCARGPAASPPAPRHADDLDTAPAGRPPGQTAEAGPAVA